MMDPYIYIQIKYINFIYFKTVTIIIVFFICQSNKINIIYLAFPLACYTQKYEN